MSKNLVAYYSRRGENYVDGRIQNLDVGNTEIAAGMVRLLTHGDLFRIEPVQEYSPDYCTCIDQARQDLCRGVRLELKWSLQPKPYHHLRRCYAPCAPPEGSLV